MIIRDFQGNPVPYGKVSKMLVENFMSGSLPSWLSSSAGTPTFSIPPESRGYLQITTGATPGSVARLQTLEINPSDFEAIIWSVEGLVCDTDTSVNIGIGINGANAGAVFFQTNTDVRTKIRIHHSTGYTDYYINHRLRGGGEAIQKRNIGVMYLPKLKKIYLMEEDQVMHEQDLSGITISGNVRGVVDITTPESKSHYMRVSQVRLELQHN